MSKETLKLTIESLVRLALDEVLPQIEEALAKQEQDEPVARVHTFIGSEWAVQVLGQFNLEDKFYTKPQPAQKPWVGLTSEDIYACDQRSNLPQHDITNADLQAFAYEIEAKLKEKNK